MRPPIRALALVALLGAADLSAQSHDSLTAPLPNCSSCAEWNAPHRPFRIHGGSYYVGTEGLSAILVTSRDGHVLIDAGLPESAPQILANIQALGFRPSDVKLVLNSHAHFDHAGGIAAIRRATGAEVAASRWSARVIETGQAPPDDPQHRSAIPYPGAGKVRVLADGDTVRVGALTLVAHLTPGHTPGGTSWSWRSCEEERCLEIVYADSQTPVSDDDFEFTRSRTYTTGVADFRRGHALLESLRCDILLTPHPGASQLFARAEGRADGPRLIDPDGCRRYAANARAALERRLAKEAAAR